jgi:lipopolysaccharide transport system permease protein
MFKNVLELVNYKDLLLSITIKEIKIRYKQSVIGILWSILQPLSMMIIFTIVFSRIAGIPSDGIPYPLFSYCALLPWQFFSRAFSSATVSLVSNTNLVQQIYFPREIFPLSSVIAAFYDFLIASSIFIILLIFYKTDITFYALFAILLLILQILFVLGVSFLGSALNVFYRDIGQALSFITQIWMFATPIIYPVSVVPEKLRPFYILNPMAGIIDGYRNVIIKGLPPNWQYVGISTVVTLIVLVFSYKYFKNCF